MKRAFLSLGSNMGDRVWFMQKAIEKMESDSRVLIKKRSSYYETEPVGYVEQDKFINQVIEIATDFDPYDLLEYCLNIESELGRVRLERWGPRVIDIDILLYEGIFLSTEALTIPHPRMVERLFVLVPLREIAPNEVFLGLSCCEWIKRLDCEQGVVKLS